MEIQIQIEPVAALDSGSPTQRMFLLFHRYKYKYKYIYKYKYKYDHKWKYKYR